MKPKPVLQICLAAVAALISGCSGSHRSPAYDAMTLLRQNQDAMFALKSYRAECVTKLTYDKPKSFTIYQFSALTAEKPTKMRYDCWERVNPKGLTLASVSSKTSSLTFTSIGAIRFLQFGKYYRFEESSDPKRLSTDLEPWIGFYSKESSYAGVADSTKTKGGTCDLKYGGSQAVDGVDCDVVYAHIKNDYLGQKIDQNDMYYIAKFDHLIRRMTEHFSTDGKPGYTRDAILQNIDLHPKVDPGIYRYVPPKGVVAESERKEEPVIASGQSAPDFSAVDPSGKTVTLSQFKGKVVIVDFWASWCAPCMQSMPHTQAVAKEAADAGIPIVAMAVDDGELKQGFMDWTSSHKSDYPNLTFLYVDQKPGVSSPKYKVSGIPSVFVIDKNGIITKSFVGYGGPTDDLRDAIRGAASKG